MVRVNYINENEEDQTDIKATTVSNAVAFEKNSMELQNIEEKLGTIDKRIPQLEIRKKSIKKI